MNVSRFPDSLAWPRVWFEEASVEALDPVIVGKEVRSKLRMLYSNLK